ncbi:hypothetical protein, partial [Halobacterium hubeiense]|uniref:hypothetical protein n=1 Tax=Halobacterium hubeiense TaxID=1407499 RepID=UPI001C5013BB
ERARAVHDAVAAVDERRDARQQREQCREHATGRGLRAVGLTQYASVGWRHSNGKTAGADAVDGGTPPRPERE